MKNFVLRSAAAMIAIVAFTAMSFGTSAAYSQTPGVTGFTGGSQFGSFFGGAVDGDVVGFRFTSDLDQVATALGVWGQDTAVGFEGLTSSHQVGLWRNSDMTLLGSVTVSPIDIMIGDWHYANLTAPINLIAGEQYTLGALYNEGGVSDNDNYISTPTSISLNGISLTNGVSPAAGDLGFVYPTTDSGNLARLGPNLLLTTSAIPEPSSIALLLVGATIGFVRRRR